MKTDSLVGSVMRWSGLQDRQLVERAFFATLRALGEGLVASERSRLRGELPERLARAILEGDEETWTRPEEFYLAVAEHMGEPVGRARELAEVVCECLGRELSPELVSVLERALPGAVTAPMRRVRTGSSADVPPHAVFAAAPTAHTVAAGRHGMRSVPLADAVREPSESELSSGAERED